MALTDVENDIPIASRIADLETGIIVAADDSVSIHNTPAAPSLVVARETRATACTCHRGGGRPRV